MKRAALAIAATVLGVGIGLAVFLPLTRGGSGTVLVANASLTAGAATAQPGPPQGRIVMLSRTMPLPSTGRQLHAKLVSGSVPAAGSDAVVLNDLDCAPDAAGFSHCRNPLRLANGQRVVVIHPHSMADVPCLTRGEHVRLVWRKTV